VNYVQTYGKLIARATKRVCVNGYVERHHILPKALGGSDDSSNLVALTAREHFIAHLLLARIYGGSMWHAVTIMKKDGRGSSRSFEIARKQLSLSMIGNKKTLGRKASDDEKAQMSAFRKGKKGRVQSEETKALLSSFNSGKIIPQVTRDKISESQKGKAKPEGFGAKVSASLKGKPRPQSVKDKLSAHYAALREAKTLLSLVSSTSSQLSKETI